MRGSRGAQIPVTLHDSLMARLDRLGPAKGVIQVGAVIGSDFSYELLHAVHPILEEDLQQALRSLPMRNCYTCGALLRKQLTSSSTR